jgi:hypothetical protein
MPLVDFLDGVGEIEGWIHQQVLLDADRSLLGIDHAQMSAFKGAQACPRKLIPRISTSLVIGIVVVVGLERAA